MAVISSDKLNLTGVLGDLLPRCAHSADITPAKAITQKLCIDGCQPQEIQSRPAFDQLGYQKTPQAKYSFGKITPKIHRYTQTAECMPKCGVFGHQ